MHRLIDELDLGHHEGPFELITNGSKPSYRNLDWPGDAGEIVVAEAIYIGKWHTDVYIDGVAYNSVCFNLAN